MRSHLRLNIAIAFGFVVVLLLGGCAPHKAEMLQNERLDDFKKLYKAYNDNPNATNIDDLIQILALRGEKLNNPFRKDSTKPCYRLMIVSNHIEVGPNTILIEETNTKAANVKYVLYLDGTVLALRKNE